MVKIERAKRPKKHVPDMIVEYHPTGKLDKLRRIVRNKLTFGLRTRVTFEESPHEHPEHGRVYGTSIRKGTRVGG
jgi:hypothetical protein